MNNLLSTILLILISTFAFAQHEATIIDIDDDGDSVIDISGDASGSNEYKRMILGFNQSNDGWIRMTTAHKLSLWTKNKRRMTVDTFGQVGIGTSIPTELLDVRGNANIEGSLNQVGTGNTHIESTAGTITIKTAAATVTIDENGNINIDAAKNIAINAQGDIEMSAQNIKMTALSNIELTAGDDIMQTADEDITFDAINVDVETNLYNLNTINLSTNALLNSTHTVGNVYTLSPFQYTLNASSLVKLDGMQINLNSGTLGAARRFDPIVGSASSNGNVTGQIFSASGTVLIGN